MSKRLTTIAIVFAPAILYLAIALTLAPSTDAAEQCQCIPCQVARGEIEPEVWPTGKPAVAVHADQQTHERYTHREIGFWEWLWSWFCD